MLLARNRNFRLLFSASAISNLGDGISALAFPWLASLITRDPFLIGLVAAAGRLAWLLFTLPVGVVTDRVDRQRLMVRTDVLRMLLTFGVVALILSAPPMPLAENAVEALPMIAGLAAAAFLLGVAEVFRDNAAQTALPSVVDKAELERANGQLWSVEQIMGQFIGPPLAGLLIATAVPVPFIVDAVSFGLAAWLIWCISMPRVALAPSGGFWAQFKEGAAWMARHRTILTFAIMLSLLNFVTFGSLTLLVLLSQELYGLDAAGYGILLTAGAAGAVLGGMLGPKIAGALGGLRTVQVALVIMAVPFAMLALTQSAVVAGLALGLMWFGGMTWNVVTVSLRQRVIPAQLLGRVNAIYRFFGWGSIPLGAFAAGLLVSMAEPSLGRIAALQLPFWIGAGTVLALLGWALTRLRFDGA
jgi:MFS family permease